VTEKKKLQSFENSKINKNKQQNKQEILRKKKNEKQFNEKTSVNKKSEEEY
jgi:hypothetical protein